jgi:ribonuclease-3
MSARRLGELAHALGYTFRDAALAEHALTHSSLSAGEPVRADNEQLEYLGDALIGFLVADYLVGAFPHWSEGQLSKSRARLVSAPALSAAAKRLGLGDFLQLGAGEEKTGGREKPALLADAFEAVAAAIYLDAGLPAARDFVVRTLLEKAITAEVGRLDDSDYKSALQEWLQGRGMQPAIYEVVREAGPDHRKTFWVEVRVCGAVGATGSGGNKKEAEQSAAAQALAQLRAAGG